MKKIKIITNAAYKKLQELEQDQSLVQVVRIKTLRGRWLNACKGIEYGEYFVFYTGKGVDPAKFTTIDEFMWAVTTWGSRIEKRWVDYNDIYFLYKDHELLERLEKTISSQLASLAKNIGEDVEVEYTPRKKRRR